MGRGFRQASTSCPRSPPKAHHPRLVLTCGRAAARWSAALRGIGGHRRGARWPGCPVGSPRTAGRGAGTWCVDPVDAATSGVDVARRRAAPSSLMRSDTTGRGSSPQCWIARASSRRTTASGMPVSAAIWVVPCLQALGVAAASTGAVSRRASSPVRLSSRSRMRTSAKGAALRRTASRLSAPVVPRMLAGSLPGRRGTVMGARACWVSIQ